MNTNRYTDIRKKVEEVSLIALILLVALIGGWSLAHLEPTAAAPLNQYQGTGECGFSSGLVHRNGGVPDSNCTRGAAKKLPNLNLAALIDRELPQEYNGPAIVTIVTDEPGTEIPTTVVITDEASSNTDETVSSSDEISGDVETVEEAPKHQACDNGQGNGDSGCDRGNGKGAEKDSGNGDEKDKTNK